MSAIASQITSLTIVYSIVYSDADPRKHQISASLAFVWGIHRGPVNSPHKWPVTRKMFPFDDVIMASVNKVMVGSDNGLSPIRWQAIIGMNVGLWSIEPLETNCGILIKIQKFLFTKMHLKISFAKWRTFCPGGDELIYIKRLQP